jgi:hypothetical protein
VGPGRGGAAGTCGRAQPDARRGARELRRPGGLRGSPSGGWCGSLRSCSGW